MDDPDLILKFINDVAFYRHLVTIQFFPKALFCLKEI